MKAIFPLLLCYVLMTAQTFALSGGPVYRNVDSYVGYYGGTLRPVASAVLPVVPGSKPFKPSALGVYTLTVGQTTTSFSIDTTTTSSNTALTSGQFVLFLEGTTYIGAIGCVVNPISGNLSGIMNSQGQLLSSTGEVVTSSADGYITAKLKTNSSNSQSTALRMNGKANLTVAFGPIDAVGTVAPTQSIVFNVTGYQQTTSIVVTSSGTSSTGTAGSSGNIGTGT